MLPCSMDGFMIFWNEQESAAKDTGGVLPRVVDSVFRQDGSLVRLMGMEDRHEQWEMAVEVAKHMESDTPLLFEAGTGVGKSLAYLIPGIIRAMDEKRPFIVSTHTIALQEQIKNKDLVLVREFFEKHDALRRYAQFKTCLLVGRNNYLCTTRLDELIRSRRDLLPLDDEPDVERIVEWSARTKTGMLSELNPPPKFDVWEWVNADSHLCNSKNCNSDHCFYRKARKELETANVIIVNHSLLFSLLGAGLSPGKDQRGILLHNDFVVLDEAHTVHATATSHFGLGVSSYGFEKQLRMLYNPVRRKGLLKVLGADDSVFEPLEKCFESSKSFFGWLHQNYLSKKSVIRIREPMDYDASLNLCLRKLIERLKLFADEQKEEKRGQQVKDICGRLSEYSGNIDAFLSMAKEDHIHWLERSGRHENIISLKTAPLDVAPYLRKNIFERNTSVTLTSATLTVDGSMTYFQKQTGSESADARTVASPFDYKRQMQILIASDSLDPAHEKSKRLNTQWLADAILWAVRQVEGGSLVLFTGYQDLYATADLIDPILEKMGRPFFCQGRGAGRTELTRRFADAGNGVLLGTDSFWTGVDVPGSALSQVIITRLPFENPDHPIIEAKEEWLKSRGLNPFLHFHLPNAVIKFRQGCGRLIRKKTDTGKLMVLDSRALRKTYGQLFISSLPHSNITSINAKDRV